MSAYALPGLLFPPLNVAPRGSEPFLEEKCEPNDGVSSSHHYSESAGEVGIAVKAARIDTSRLMYALARPRVSKSPPSLASLAPTKEVIPVPLQEERSIFRKTTSCYCGEIGQTESEDEEEEDFDQIQDTTEEVVTDSSTSPESSTAHTDAIQFDLSISFNGRKYTATRTLPRLMKLRDDLRGEVQRRQNRWVNRRSGGFKKTSTADEEPDVTIPDIPFGPKSEETTVLQWGNGRGFTMLQAMLQTYCPAIERWLLNVANLVPPDSSPCLTDFLWEPLGNNIECQKLLKNGIRPVQTLGAIYEDESDDEIDDEF